MSYIKRKGGSRYPKSLNLPYRAWICSLECLITNIRFGPRSGRSRNRAPHRCAILPGRYRVEPAHVKTWGSSGRDMGNLVPLCPSAHDEQEGRTREFEAKYGINLLAAAKRLEAEYHEVA